MSEFVRVSESGSFSRAARDMNLSQPSVSRIVSELEARLGVKLLHRTTRRLTLTAAGEGFFERAREILAELDDAEDAARGSDSLRGTLRVALPVVFGMNEVVPRLPDFLGRYPLLRVELRVSDAYQDLVAEGGGYRRPNGQFAQFLLRCSQTCHATKICCRSPVVLECARHAKDARRPVIPSLYLRSW